MSGKVLAENETTAGQTLRTINVYLLIGVIVATIGGTYFTIGKDLVLVPIALGIPTAFTLMFNILYLHDK